MMIVQQRPLKAGSTAPATGGGRSLIPVARRSIPNLSALPSTAERSSPATRELVNHFNNNTGVGGDHTSTSGRSKQTGVGQEHLSSSHHHQQTAASAHRGISRSESTLNAATVTLYNRNRNATTINSDELWRRPATVSKHHQWPPPLSATNEELPRSESSLLSSTDLSVIGSDSPNTDFASADLRINIRHHSSSTLHQQQQKMLNSRSASEGIQHCSSTNSITTSSTITATATATSSSSSSVKASFVLAKTDKGAKVDQTSQQQLRKTTNGNHRTTTTATSLLNGASLSSSFSSSTIEETSKRGSVSLGMKNGASKVVVVAGADGVLKRRSSGAAAGAAGHRRNDAKGAQAGAATVCNCEVQLEQQLQEKDLQIMQLESQLDDLYFAVEDKDQHIEQLLEEIRKRKADLAELSRKIIAMDQELKAFQLGPLQHHQNMDFGRMSAASRPFSPVYSVCDSSICPDQQPQQTNSSSNTANRWFPPLRTFTSSKTKNGSSAKMSKGGASNNNSNSKKSNNEYVHELKSILREKEMMITELRLESKLTSSRLEELETTLRRREEESVMMRKTNDYLEKAVKSKLLD